MVPSPATGEQFQFADTKIDNVFTLDCPDFHKFPYHSQTCIVLSGNVLRGIYPDSLTLNKEHGIIHPSTGLPSGKIPMFDVHICCNAAPDQIVSGLIDKRQSPHLTLSYPLH
jgi:hypothetical protein